MCFGLLNVRQLVIDGEHVAPESGECGSMYNSWDTRTLCFLDWASVEAFHLLSSIDATYRLLTSCLIFIWPIQCWLSFSCRPITL